VRGLWGRDGRFQPLPGLAPKALTARLRGGNTGSDPLLDQFPPNRVPDPVLLTVLSCPFYGVTPKMVNKSAKADLRATKMLFDMMKEVEQKARAAAPPEPDKLTPADEEVVEQFLARLRCQIAAETAEAAAAAAAEQPG
jgi:hypothetical protein